MNIFEFHRGMRRADYRAMHRYDHVGRMLGQLSVKCDGKVNWGFIIHVTPFIASLNADAVDTVLERLVSGPKVELCLGAIYQPVRELMIERGLLDPDIENDLAEPADPAETPRDEWDDLDLASRRIQ